MEYPDYCSTLSLDERLRERLLLGNEEENTSVQDPYVLATQILMDDSK